MKVYGAEYNGRFADYDSEGDDPTSVLLDDSSSCRAIQDRLSAAAQDLTDAEIVYDPVFYNSNAAARELLERSELPTDKKRGGWTPGWSTELD